ncbi:3-deoxy-D-manno-octulosonate 8-phosphate phosphatase [Catenovulum agarivorans DS-2]|uniref:3-deoxy-D-manno-octulosonate 8-phosphate phosphatase KdsC n=1 Tax=Catenovulum agarivorans DS-2 TaxID=1328313 RepID=W7QJK0_9ALTE|nr:3-deoxy-manno-octulosonate-8-phosphatase KdsC [Catenovulum agarivorans]EWH09132.1 3-deoxy-D-manno-octulosonate 8-phosphate phosphatase [Catenovulum agarivorans DS-2]
MLFNSIYGPIKQNIAEQFKHTKLFICDIDGVFSDGRIYLGNQGEELKAFHTRDGFGIKAIINAGIQVAVITGRKSNIVEKRMQSLGIQHIYQGQEDKLQAYAKLKNTLNITDEQVAYIGDDVPDLTVMQKAGLAIAVADAHPIIQQISHYQTRVRGGFGAVRECCDILLQTRGVLEQAQGMSV